MLTTRDTVTGVARWSGTYLVNPWEDGKLVSLSDYPRLARYLESWNGEVKGRHVAQKNPDRWYRTIDRVDYVVLDTSAVPGWTEDERRLFREGLGRQGYVRIFNREGVEVFERE